MFLISKFLPPSSLLASQIFSAMAKSDFSCVETLFFPGFCHCAADLATQVPKLCTDLNLGFLYILILRTYSKFARKNHFQRSALALRSPARALAAGLPRQDHVHKTTDESFRFHNKISMKCIVNWIPLRIRVRSRNTQPHLKEICKGKIRQTVTAVCSRM